MGFLVEFPVTVLLFREVWGMESIEKHSSIASWVKILSLLPFQRLYNGLKLFLYHDLLLNKSIFAIFAYLKSISAADAVRFFAMCCSALFAYAITHYKKHTNIV